jgi:hydroxymethylglutaryl-CoA lyase
VNLPKKVNLVEVGPRDGLQNILPFIDTDEKVALIDSLGAAGLRRIEVTSFVHPKAVPQMRDAADVLRRIHRYPGIKYCVLVPNLVGAKMALDSGVDEINVVISASESHNMKNLNRTVAQSLEEFNKISELCLQCKGIWLKATIATAFGCPYEGKIDPPRIKTMAKWLVESGAGEITLADTAGMGNPLLTEKIIRILRKTIKDTELSAHFHNNKGKGLVNTFAALLAGVTNIETAIGGLGGCPFIPESAGNVATEDLANLLSDMRIDTGIDLDAINHCAKTAIGMIKKYTVHENEGGNFDEKRFQDYRC